MAAAAKAKETVKNVAQALLAAQKEAPALQKNAINPHFSNRYISLDSLMEQVLPVLNKHELLLVQAPTTLEDGVTPALRTTLEHPASETCTTSVMPLILDKQNPQGQGSAITYARRYALMAMLGLVADTDDDGELASQPKRRPRAPKATETTPDLNEDLSLLDSQLDGTLPDGFTL